jgi:hypothetical protein
VLGRLQTGQPQLEEIVGAQRERKALMRLLPEEIAWLEARVGSPRTGPKKNARQMRSLRAHADRRMVSGEMR